MSEKECMQILAIVRSVYPNVKIEDAGSMVKGWMLELGDYSASSVYKAARLHMSTNRFFPTPADIREKIIRAELVYTDTEIETKKIGSGAKALQTDSSSIDEYLENLCKFVGLGYPNEIEDD